MFHVQPNQFVPAVEIHHVVRAAYFQWQQEHEARMPKWQAQNIRFDHDPSWKESAMSLERVRGYSTPFTMALTLWTCAPWLCHMAV